MIEAKGEMYSNIVNRYIEENCDSKGNQLEDNLDAKIESGLKEIESLKESHYLAFGQTDKSGKFPFLLNPNPLKTFSSR